MVVFVILCWLVFVLVINLVFFIFLVNSVCFIVLLILWVLVWFKFFFLRYILVLFNNFVYDLVNVKGVFLLIYLFK